MKRQRFFGSLAALAVVFGAACSNQSTGGTVGRTGVGGGAGGAVGAAGVSGPAGSSGGSTGSAGADTSGTAGSSAAGAPGGGVAGGGVAGAGVAGAGAAGAGAPDAGTSDAATTGTGGGTAPGDTPAWREINIQDAKQHNVRFSAFMADPTVTNDETNHSGDNEIAEVNTAKPLKKKLCVVLTGIGTGPGQGIGDWAGGQGYHVFQVGYSNDIAMAADGDTNTATPGNTRMNQFDGKGRTPSNANTKRADSIEERVIKGIQYLETADPGADWGWFLNQDGTMRWSDGCFIGYSYGATHLAVIARYVRLGLGVSVSGPQSEGHPDADWLKMPSATPLERVFAMWGSEDEPAVGANGYSSHYTVTTMLLGYLGAVTHLTVGGPNPPYTGLHRFSVDGQGHTEFCAGNPPNYCNYMFSLPPYDQ